ncbi:MAG: glycerol-3-phosphate 1-O-acyltransferase PlsY [Candidatus Eisenbacteria bacterium]
MSEGEVARAAVALATAFLLGSLPFGLWWGKAIAGIDPREHGSRNLGATNVYRVLGARHGIAVLLLDVGKGIAAVCLARGLSAAPGIPLLAGLLAVAGHMATPFARFRGGKGVATGLGIWIVLAPAGAAAALAVFAAVLALSRRVSAASLSAAAALPIAVWLLPSPEPVLPRVLFALVTGGLVWLRHRTNLARLARGQEPPLWGAGT